MRAERDLSEFEADLRSKGYSVICGVDEAGRGPLAGPVCAAAVILPDGCVIEGLDDSKKLSEKKRDALFDVIKDRAVAYGIAMSHVDEIEEINILNATFAAMNRAVALLDVKADVYLIDGNTVKGIESENAQAVVSGDERCASIAAASVLAKVTRDRYMVELANVYPEYGFERHKGYGTKKHTEAIHSFGVTKEHRTSFLKKILTEV